MILNQNTLTILKNFSLINQGIIIKPGSLLRTVSIRKNIFASCPIADEFPREFALYDLGEFIATLKLFEKPDLDFKDEYILITDEDKKSKIKYFYSAPTVVVAPPDKSISMPEADISFSFTETMFNKVMKAASVMKLKTLGMTSSGLSVENDTGVGNIFDLDCDVSSGNGDTADKKFNISIDNLKIIEGSYDVDVSGKGLARFSCVSPAYEGLEYYIALEVDK